jgi:Acetyltransferase (GNAT) family
VSGRLADLLSDAAAGRFPPPDGSVTILPQPSRRDVGVIAFTAHSVVFVDLDPAWVRGLLPPGDLSGPLLPPFLQALSSATGRRVNSTDLLCIATPQPGPPEMMLTPAMPSGHPRVTRALRHRDHVRVWETPGAVLSIGCGVAGRWEVALEVDPGYRGKGLGSELASAARHLVPDGAPLWAQIAPGNAASVRAFLAAGFRPVGAEALLPQA